MPEEEVEAEHLQFARDQHSANILRTNTHAHSNTHFPSLYHTVIKSKKSTQRVCSEELASWCDMFFLLLLLLSVFDIRGDESGRRVVVIRTQELLWNSTCVHTKEDLH